LKCKIAKSKVEKLTEQIFTNTLYQELVLSDIVTPEGAERFTHKEKLMNMFVFETCNEAFMEVIKSAGLENEYNEFRKTKIEGICDLIERED